MKEFITIDLSPFWREALPEIAMQIDKAEKRILLGLETAVVNTDNVVVASVDVQKNKNNVVITMVEKEKETAPEHPCSMCGFLDCENCPVRKGISIKFYTPTEARETMYCGKVLKNKHGYSGWYERGYGFLMRKREGESLLSITDFSGFYSEESNPENDPAKQHEPKNYTPKEAIIAMLNGKILKNKKSWEFFWGYYKGELSFWFWVNEDKKAYNACDFSNLYSDNYDISASLEKNKEGVLCLSTKSS